MTLLVLLAACARDYYGGGTAVGNPGLVSVRLGADPGDSATADVRIALRSCAGAVWRSRFRHTDLLRDREALPGGEFCSLSLTLRDLETAGGLAVERVELELELPALRTDGTSWVIELGSPAGEIASASALFVDVDDDGRVDALERAEGPVAAGALRGEEAAEPVYVVSAWNGLLATLPEGGSQLDDRQGDAWSAVVAVDGLLVAVGGDGEGRVARSLDSGRTWSSQVTAELFSDVDATEAGLVASGFEGGVYTSSDAATWSRVIDGGAELLAVAAGPDEQIAVGDGRVVVGGATGWTEVTLDSGRLLDVVWGAPGWVAVGEDGRRWFSTTGEAWTETGGTGLKLSGVAWSGSAYVAVGEDGSGWRSADGIGWEALDTPALDRLVAWDGLLLGVGGEEVLASEDLGTTWTTKLVVDGVGDAGLSGVAGFVP